MIFTSVRILTRPLLCKEPRPAMVCKFMLTASFNTPGLDSFISLNNTCEKESNVRFAQHIIAIAIQNIKRYVFVMIILLQALVLSAAQPRAGGRSLQVRLHGISNETLIDDLVAVSMLLKGYVQADSSARQVRWQASKDCDDMLKVLKAHSFFGSEIEFEISLTNIPKKVDFNVKKGPAYKLSGVTVSFTDETNAVSSNHIYETSENYKPNIKDITAIEGEILHKYRNNGYPFARHVKRLLKIDHETREVELIVQIYLGPQAFLGTITVNGLVKVKPYVIEQRMKIKEGDLFSRKKLLELESELLGSGLFSTARAEYSDTPQADGLIPITLNLSERKHRTIRLGLEHSSDVGMGAKVKWEHRNLFGRGNRLSLDTEVSEIGSESKLTYTVDKLKKSPFSFGFSLETGEEDTDAYKNYATETRMVYGYEPIKDLRLIAGIGFRSTEVEQLATTNKYNMGFIPLFLAWDRRSNIFDPRRGFRFLSGIVPVSDFKSDLTFTILSIQGSVYHTLRRLPQITMAAKVEGSAIQGADRDEIPADSRLYAGGASSVRGYEFQSIGPRSGDVPLGGTKRTTGSLEMRYRAESGFGAVIFYDIGSISDETSLNNEFRSSLGIGARYSTGMGPIRLDLAFPINKRKDIDDSIQIYVSIGHFF